MAIVNLLMGFPASGKSNVASVRLSETFCGMQKKIKRHYLQSGMMGTRWFRVIFGSIFKSSLLSVFAIMSDVNT